MSQDYSIMIHDSKYVIDILTSDGIVIPEPRVELSCDGGRGTATSVLTFSGTLTVVERRSLE